MRVDIFSSSNISLKKLNSLHYDINSNGINIGEDNENSSFKDIFFKAIDSVNNDLINVNNLTQKAMLEPDSIDVHDVSIAVAKATMQISITKSVIDKALKAYQDIINIR